MSFTTLIPAYKPAYLTELLRALQVQTQLPARVIVSDDSPDGAFLRALAEPALSPVVHRLNLSVVPGPRRGGWANCQQLLGLYGGATPYFHLLMDDDIPYPSFYARHAEALAVTAAGCAVSRRWYASETGQPLASLPVPAELDAMSQRVLRLPASILFEHIVGTGNNWLGELSNTTFRAESADDLMHPQLGGVKLHGLEDVGAMLICTQRAPLAFVNEHLGYFRTSAGQNSQQPLGRAFKLGVVGWIAFALGALRAGQLSEALARATIARSAEGVRQRYAAEADIQPFIALLPALSVGAEADEEFLRLWHDFGATR
ncbi:glycosyltransferase family 2 protein [Roseateles sp. BYS78W]|uniref:Glycosyltransferase family 2 protein n=1 Tax=Pelomonas candidula TaxID=3299025 RepID=A0ABW7HHT4_9BURK